MRGKKKIRRRFRDAVFTRDGHACVMCGAPDTKDAPLDPHHITDRSEMPHGGYVASNGISVCPECHWKAEAFHRGDEVPEGYAPEALYRQIGSSHEKAWRDAIQELGEEIG